MITGASAQGSPTRGSLARLHRMYRTQGPDARADRATSTRPSAEGRGAGRRGRRLAGPERVDTWRYTPPLRGGRGVQREDVFAAADALIAEGKRPNIERVRLKIGRGSPNTVSPLLEHWFATLAPRLAAGATPSVPRQPDGETGIPGSEDGALPVSVRSAAQALREAACGEAQGREIAQLVGDRAELQAREEALVQRQTALAQREEAFTQTRASLDAALASSQRERGALAQQLNDQAAEARQVRSRLKAELQRLAAQVAQLQDSEAQWRREQVQRSSRGTKSVSAPRSDKRVQNSKKPPA